MRVTCRQLFRAKLLDTPAAWQAVQQNFPSADPFYHALAWQGLARLHFDHQEFAAAIEPLQKLAELPADEPAVLAEALRASEEVE